MATAPIRLLRFRRYRIRYLPPLARIAREIVVQYIGDDDNTVNPTATFSGRPEVGNLSIAYDQIVEAEETNAPVQPHARKVR